MNKKMFGIALLMLFYNLPIFSQVLDSDDVFLKNRLTGIKKFKDIIHVVDSFYKKNPALRFRSTEEQDEENARTEVKEFESDKMLFWSRWAWYNSSRLDKDGNLVNTTEKNLEGLANRQNFDLANQLSRSGGQLISDEQSNSNRNQSRNTTTGEWNELGPQTFDNIWDIFKGNGRIDRIAFHPTNPNIIYAGTHNGGLWKTTDGGLSWTSLSSFTTNLGISGIVISKSNPNTIYVLTGDGDSYFSGAFVFDYGYSRPCGGVLKSTDGGTTWSRTGSFGSGNFRGFNLAQSPTNPNILIAATSLGLFRSVNAGVSWSQPLTISGSAGTSFTDVKFNPVNGNTIYAAGPNKYYYSLNGGANWLPGAFNIGITGSQRATIGVTPADTTRVYVLFGPGMGTGCGTSSSAGTFFGIYRSINGGKNFSRTMNAPNVLGTSDLGNDCSNQSSYCLGFTVSPTTVNKLAISSYTIWTSPDGGATATNVAYYREGPGNTKVHPDVHCVEYNPLDAKLYAGTDGGVYVSSDNGTNWTFISNGLNCNEIYHMASVNDDRTHLAIGLQDNGIRNRTNYGTAFNHVTGADGFSISYDPNNSSRFYHVLNTSGGRATSDGANKSNWYNFGSFFPFVNRHPTTTNNLIVGAGNYGPDTIFTSIDDGVSFTKRGNIGGNRRVAYAPSNPNTIYIASDGGAWRSTDGGANWVAIHTKPGFPTGSFTITCLTVNPVLSGVIMVSFGGYDSLKKVIYSTDGGDNWRNFSDGLPNLPVNAVVLGANNCAYIGTDDGVYYQSPYDTRWLPFYNGLPRVPVTDLVLFNTDQYIYASTFGRGIWFSPMKQVCDETLTVSGLAGGQLFYQANNLYTTQSLSGLDSTMVFYRGSNAVVMQPGFHAPSGNHMKAFIGGCDDHTLPTYRDSQTSKSLIICPTYLEEPNPLRKNGARVAYLEYTPEQKKQNKLTVIAKEIGNYILRISDSGGIPIKEFNVNMNQEDAKEWRLNIPELSSGRYYVELRKDNRLCHFLEWMIN